MELEHFDPEHAVMNPRAYRGAPGLAATLASAQARARPSLGLTEQHLAEMQRREQARVEGSARLVRGLPSHSDWVGGPRADMSVSAGAYTQPQPDIVPHTHGQQPQAFRDAYPLMQRQQQAQQWQAQAQQQEQEQWQAQQQEQEQWQAQAQQWQRRRAAPADITADYETTRSAAEDEASHFMVGATLRRGWNAPAQAIPAELAQASMQSRALRRRPHSTLLAHAPQQLEMPAVARSRSGPAPPPQYYQPPPQGGFSNMENGEFVPRAPQFFPARDPQDKLLLEQARMFAPDINADMQDRLVNRGMNIPEPLDARYHMMRAIAQELPHAHDPYLRRRKQ